MATDFWPACTADGVAGFAVFWSPDPASTLCLYTPSDVARRQLTLEPNDPRRLSALSGQFHEHLKLIENRIRESLGISLLPPLAGTEGA